MKTLKIGSKIYDIDEISGKLVIPRLVCVKTGSVVILKNYVKNAVVTVNAFDDKSGCLGKSYTKGDIPSDTEFTILDDGILIPPTDPEEDTYLVKYEHISDIRLKNPQFKELIIDPIIKRWELIFLDFLQELNENIWNNKITIKGVNIIWENTEKEMK